MNSYLSPIVLFFAAVACGQQEKPKPQQPPVDPVAQAKQLVEEMQQQFKTEGITVDAKAQTVTIKTVVNEFRDPVEYLLIHRKGKRHEAVFYTMSKPSVLNAALLLVGFEQGKNAQVIEKNPPPTLEEVEKGVDPVIIVPAKGAPFWMTVQWKDEAGKTVEHCIEDLIYELSTQEPVRAVQWVYLGGRMAKLYKDEPEVYVADFEGNLVSTCYMSPDNHLATMVHPNARDDHNWWTTNLLPPPGTEVELTFHHVEPKLCIERGQRLAKEDAEAAKAKAKDGGKDGGKSEPPK